MISDEEASLADKKMVDALSNVVEILDRDDQFSSQIDDFSTESTRIQSEHSPLAQTASISSTETTRHSHESLKQFVCTRWNSNLFMIESILDLKVEVHNALLKTGNGELCFFENEITILNELRCFLKPFEALTELVSGAGSVLSFQPLMKVKIRKLCEVKPGDDLSIQLLKQRVLRTVEKRIPESDTVKVYQVMDPETRSFFTQAEACKFLTAALGKVEARGCVITGYSAATSTDAPSAEGDSPTSKRRRLKQELLREMR